MSWKAKGIKDGRAANKYDEPKRDWSDRNIAGYTENDEQKWKNDYHEGYKIGTSQRIADSNLGTTSDGGSGK